MLNPFKLIAILSDLNKIKSISKESGPMSTAKVAQYLHVFVSLFGTIGVPALFSHWVVAHQPIYFGLVAASIALHSISPSIFPGPSDSDKKATSLTNVCIVLFALFAFATTASAQTTLPTNLYAGGISYNSGASNPVAGTAMYDRLTTDSTYAFTALDILPISVKPFTVSTNVSVGVAQKVLTWNNINFFTPTSAGLSITGNNTGWTWTSGILADYNIKKSGKATQYHVQPNVRWLKSSVSGGSDYQLIGGALFAWGK